MMNEFPRVLIVQAAERSRIDLTGIVASAGAAQIDTIPADQWTIDKSVRDFDAVIIQTDEPGKAVDPLTAWRTFDLAGHAIVVSELSERSFGGDMDVDRARELLAVRGGVALAEDILYRDSPLKDIIQDWFTHLAELQFGDVVTAGSD